MKTIDVNSETEIVSAWEALAPKSYSFEPCQEWPMHAESLREVLGCEPCGLIAREFKSEDRALNDVYFE